MIYKWETIGHTRQIDKLEQEISENNVSHAYLFSGPKDIGKYRISNIFANILLCNNGYCKTCDICRHFQAGSHPDVFRMRDNGEIIRIDQVRDIIRKTNLTSQGGRRIILIDNIERMLIAAQNSFLKTLEEPAGNTIFLMTSTKLNQVLPTIKSRVRMYSFYNIDDNVLHNALLSQYGENSDLDEIIQIAQGRPGLAIKLIRNSSELIDQRNTYNQIEFFLKNNALSQKFKFIDELSSNQDQLELFFDSFSRYLRKLIYEYLNNGSHPLKTRFTLKNIVDLFESLEKTRYHIERNINKKLALENFFLKTEK